MKEVSVKEKEKEQLQQRVRTNHDSKSWSNVFFSFVYSLLVRKVAQSQTRKEEAVTVSVV